MGNCAKRSENRNHLLKVKLDETLCYFLSPSNSDEVTILYCYISILFILPTTVLEQLTVSLPAVRTLVNFLKVASTDSEFNCSHSFVSLCGGTRMHGFEIGMAVGALAHNKTARKEMATNKVFEHLVRYGVADNDTYHQELTLTAIHTLLGQETVLLALQVAELQPLIDRLMQSSTDGVRQGATRVSEKLKALKIPPKRKYCS